MAYRDDEMGFNIDRYNSHRNIGKKVKRVDLNVRWFTMVYNNAELILIGGVDAQSQVLNSVNITKYFFLI